MGRYKELAMYMDELRNGLLEESGFYGADTTKKPKKTNKNIKIKETKKNNINATKETV